MAMQNNYQWLKLTDVFWRFYLAFSNLEYQPQELVGDSA